MIPVIRKLSVVIILILLLIVFNLLKFNTADTLQINTLITLGFIIITAFLLGELTGLIGLPKLSGYLLAGIIFGPFSHLIFKSENISIITNKTLTDLNLLNGIVAGLIALMVGGEISLRELWSNKKVILLVILLKLIFIPTFILSSILIIAPYVPIFNGLSFNELFFVGIFIGVMMLATSSFVAAALMRETENINKLSKLVLSIAVIKDFLVIVLIYLLFFLSKGFLASGNSFNEDIVFLGLSELLMTITIGVILGLLINVYLKYVKFETLIIVIALILVVIEVARYLNISSLLVLIVTGIVVKNFSKFEEEIFKPIQKYSLPILLLFFTILGANINLNSLSQVFYLAMFLFALRLLLLYFVTKISTKLAGEDTSLQNNLWMGFIPQSALSIGLLIYLSASLQNFIDVSSTIVLSVVGLNIIAGPALFKLALKNFNRAKEEKKEQEEVKIEEKYQKEIIPHKRFNIPQFADPDLNNLVISLRERLINHLKEFENNLINKRSEEAIEFYYQVVEKYIEEYQKLKNLFTKGKVTGKEIKEEVLKIQREISEWFAQLSINRKSVEQQILQAEYLIQKLFDDLRDYCETVPEYLIVEQETDKYELEIDDNFPVRFAKFFKRLHRRLRKILRFKSGLKRKIPYVTLVKYFFEYQIAFEMEKVAFFLGLERLNVLRKVKMIYDDVTLNLEEMLNLIAEYKDIDAVSLLAIDKLNEIHERLKQEISSIGEEIESSNQNISTRLNYAFANPFNQFVKTILKAGTLELNIRKYQFSKFYTETQKTKETTLETIRFWVNYFLGFLGVSERDARVFEITVRINSIVNDTIIHYSDSINSQLRNLIGEISSLLKSFEKDISDERNLNLQSIELIKNIITKYRDDVIYLLNEKGIGKLNYLKKTHSLNNTINSLKERFNAIVKEYDDEIKVLDEKDFELTETRTKYIELKTIHFTEIVKSFFENEILQEIIKLNELVSGHISSAILELKNIQNVIYYHFNIAMEEINRLEKESNAEEFPEEIQKIINDTLKTSTKLIRDKIKVWDRQIEKFEREIEVSLTEKIYKQINSVQEAFRKELTFEAEKQNKNIKYQEFLDLSINKLNEFSKKIIKHWKVTKDKLEQFLKPLIRDFNGIHKHDYEEKSLILHSYEQTIYDQNVYNSLPFVYKKLFDYSSSEIIEILVGREKEKEILAKAYERTLRGLPGSTAIIGESGTGKSSLITAFIAKAQIDTDVSRLTFEKTISSENDLLKLLSELLRLDYIATYEELISELNVNPKYKAIILEDIHKIYLRKYGHLEAMKKLLLIISETGHKIFWIISISYHAWQLLNKILNISNFFPYQIKTEVLTKDQIKEAILKRHKTSGFELEYLSYDSFKLYSKSKSNLINKERQQSLEEEYFNNLYEACAGNITSALFYWIKSIKEFKNNKIYIAPFKKLDFKFLHFLEIDKLLTLSNLIQHGSLTVTEHCEIFNIDTEKSKAILNFLNATNLILYDVNEVGEKVYYLNPAVYKPIEIELRKLHIFD